MSIVCVNISVFVINILLLDSDLIIDELSGSTFSGGNGDKLITSENENLNEISFS